MNKELQEIISNIEYVRHEYEELATVIKDALSEYYEGRALGHIDVESTTEGHYLSYFRCLLEETLRIIGGDENE